VVANNKAAADRCLVECPTRRKAACRGRCHLSCVEILPNDVFSLVPMTFIATEMPAAIRPYSMAVALDASRTNALTCASKPKCC
jgi:hypothetical protein